MGKLYAGRPSTDGTRIGAEIAEVMGTDDENEIIENAIRSHRQVLQDNLTGMDAEQADWDSDLTD